MRWKGCVMTKEKNTIHESEAQANGVGVDEDDPYIYVDGKKEMKDGSGMVKESFVEEE